jgi:hypothetical protein
VYYSPESVEIVSKLLLLPVELQTEVLKLLSEDEAVVLSALRRLMPSAEWRGGTDKRHAGVNESPTRPNEGQARWR